MRKSLLKDALKIARVKLPHHPEFCKYPHYSFIIQDNKIVEWGVNRSSLAPPIHYGYCSLYKDDDGFIPKMHAEINAYQKAKGILNLNKFEMINIRLSRKGFTRCSAPCKCCYVLLKELGCKKFYYSADNNKFFSLI